MVNERILFENGKVDEAIDVMREAAKWLIDSSKPLWRLEDLSKEKLLKDTNIDEFYVLKMDSEIAGAMILKWEDLYFWPDAKFGESGFIHKLCIRRKYSGKGISELMIDYAINECKKRNVIFLRLDCAGDREKLCGFYERLGFTQVRKEIIGKFDVAFYEIRVNMEI